MYDRPLGVMNGQFTATLKSNRIFFFLFFFGLVLLIVFYELQLDWKFRFDRATFRLGEDSRVRENNIADFLV